MVTGFELALIGATAFVAAAIGGVAGYGTGLLMPLVLVPLVGAEAVVPILSISAVFNNCARLTAFRRDVEWSRVLWLIVTAAPFCFIGASLYTYLNGPQVSLLIGIVLVALVPLRYVLKRRATRIAPRTALLFGPVFGLLTGGTPGAGVVLISILMSLGLTGRAVIATDAAISIFVTSVKIGTFQALGALGPEQWTVALLIGVICIPGAFFARWLVDRMSARIHNGILDGTVVVGGLFLVLRGLGF